MSDRNKKLKINKGSFIVPKESDTFDKIKEKFF